MSIETTEISAELINAAFIDKIEGGMIKEAEEAASAYIREQLYEDGILRRLYPPRVVTADELDPNLDDDNPRIIVEKEPNATAATFVPFKGTGNRDYFTGKRFSVPFGKVESDRISKSKFELMTIRMPIMDWLKENQMKMVQQQEDEFFMDAVDACTALNISGQQISTALTTEVTFKDAFVNGLKAMNALRIPVEKVLMNMNTYLISTTLKVDHIGDSAQGKRFSSGVASEDSFMGYPVVTTIKDDLVADNVMYFFAPAHFFCKNYLLQDATLFIKTEADMYTFHTYEAPGTGIGNVRGVVKITMT